jgi:hypothetical protein
MRYLKYSVAVVVFGLGLLAVGIPSANAQVRVGVGIGVGPVYSGPVYADYDAYDPYYDPYYVAYGAPPSCVYGYFPYAPYACAPYGYWAPQYFYDGVFVGAGPWFGWGWGPSFRVRFRTFDEFRRFGGFRGERFVYFRDHEGFRGFHAGNGFRGNTFRNAVPSNSFRSVPPRNFAFRDSRPAAPVFRGNGGGRSRGNGNGGFRGNSDGGFRGKGGGHGGGRR